MFSNNFTSLTTRPTRISSFSATLIDHIWINYALNELTSGILQNDHSDHFSPFVCTVNSQSIKNRSLIYTHRNFKLSDKERVNLNLQSKLNRVIDVESTQNYYSNLSTVLTEAMNECFPYKTTKIKLKQLNNPWFTEELNSLIKQKKQTTS